MQMSLEKQIKSHIMYSGLKVILEFLQTVWAQTNRAYLLLNESLTID